MINETKLNSKLSEINIPIFETILAIPHTKIFEVQNFQKTQTVETQGQSSQMMDQVDRNNQLTGNFFTIEPTHKFIRHNSQ